VYFGETWLWILISPSLGYNRFELWFWFALTTRYLAKVCIRKKAFFVLVTLTLVPGFSPPLSRSPPFSLSHTQHFCYLM
jgi:hypothetical protein